MPKTYTATEVEEIVKECLGEKEQEEWFDSGRQMINRENIARNAHRTQTLANLEKFLSDN